MATIERWFQSHTGKLLDAENPTPDMIDIQDIAHALSMVCRYGGHCREFYSVAEHSVHVMQLGIIQTLKTTNSPRHCLALLLHDAAEAYTGDIITPNKVILAPHSTVMENRWLSAIERKLNLEGMLVDPEPLVKECDRITLSIELVSLFDEILPEWWTKFEKPTAVQMQSVTIECWSPSVARRKFLDCFNLIQVCLPRG